ncbi:SET domain-containing protein [Sistotremastrum niveocremeum HHB9708]|uniref:Histone-lysine N-methyltransferase SET5 n=1 Tax=Sistotremastrum niveocremeum HHB9708 TaxID=1314777 RepID=A0A164X6B0_9AGAM|nr:SET domain-containing protein [Sistotremastrum niveocremeum HHB9708]
MPVSPSDEELIPAIKDLRGANPTLGITKFQALLLETHKEWTVSEKRIRKILQQLGLGPQNGSDAASSKSKSNGKQYPSSKLNEALDVKQWTSKVEVKHFGKLKGKGLVASEDIAEDETIWKEDPFIIAPEWEIWDAQRASVACMHCTTPIPPSATLQISCPHTPCPAKFCSRLCLSRSAAVHPLLCPAQNPASLPLLRWAREVEWMAVHAWAHTTAKILLANEKGADELAAVRSIVDSLATFSLSDRARDIGVEPDHDAWKKAHSFHVAAFHEPSTAAEKKKLSKLIRKPLPADLAQQLFDYDAYLEGLSRMSLNLEAHGGLYALHSHLNHSCQPNASIRHLQQRTTLARITVLARRPIKKGEELTIS